MNGYMHVVYLDEECLVMAEWEDGTVTFGWDGGK